MKLFVKTDTVLATIYRRNSRGMFDKTSAIIPLDEAERLADNLWDAGCEYRYLDGNDTLISQDSTTRFVLAPYWSETL